MRSRRWSLPYLEPLDSGPVLIERDLEEDIRILEESFLQTDNHELARFEEAADHETDVLSVAQVQGRIYFIQDVDRCRVVLEEGQDQRQG